MARGGANAVPIDACSTDLHLDERERTGHATRELKVLRGDGAVFSARVSSAVLRSDAGERLAYLVVQDAGARTPDPAPRESEERFRLLANTMPQIVCVLGPAGAVEYVNPTWETFSGLDLAATARRGWEGVVHPDDLAAARGCRGRVLKTLMFQDVELRYRAADGSYRWFLSRLAPIVEDGRVVRLIGAAMEIEGRRRAEEALRQSEAKFAAIYENAPLGISLSALADRRIVSVNPAWTKMFGYTPAEAIGKTSLDLGLVMQPERYLQLYEDMRAQPSIRSWETSVRGRSGEERFFIATATRVEVSAAPMMLVAYQDITDRKRAELAMRDMEQELREADRRKDEFLGVLSHELRNPLAPIRTASYILRHAEGTDQARRARDVIERQTQHITRLVDDLLDVTRISRGKVELQRADVDLAGLALRVADDHRPVMQERGLELRAELPGERVMVNGDETRLAQVLGNLLHNAAKFTPAGGRVTLALAVEDGRAVIRIRDTGVGIGSDLLAAIFDPFTQAKQTLARSEGGLGLGLALVKGLVGMHGGEVSARSAGEGRGSEFLVTLPLLSAPTEDLRRGGQPWQSAPAVRRRVLVVDDNRDSAETLAQLAEMVGHEALVAFDGRSAIALAADHAPDVVLCDLGLPGMDGFEVARQLRAAHGSKLRLFAVSGYAQADDVARARASGFDAHLAKPMDPALLERILRT